MFNNTKNTNIDSKLLLKCKSVVVSKDNMEDEIKYVNYFGWDLITTLADPKPNHVRLVFTPNREVFNEFSSIHKH